MKISDTVSGAVLLLFAVAMLGYTFTFPPEMPGQDYGPALFPRLIGIGLVICSLLLIMDGLSARRAAPGATPTGWTGSSRHAVNFLLVIGVVVFYILAADLLGFIPTAMLSLLALLFRFGVAPAPGVALAAIITYVVYQGFAGFLRVPLPVGPVERMLFL